MLVSYICHARCLFSVSNFFLNRNIHLTPALSRIVFALNIIKILYFVRSSSCIYIQYLHFIYTVYNSIYLSVRPPPLSWVPLILVFITPANFSLANIREIREGWPLLTVDTEAIGVSRSTYERGPSLVGSFVGLVVLLQEIFVLPWLLQVAQYKIFFSSPYTISLHLSLLPSKLARQSCCVACLSICVLSNILVCF
jgi:hypothetical protein